MKNAIAKAIELEGSLDVVINNAGIGGGGFSEVFSVSQWEKIFDINVFGVQRVLKAVLPKMREKKSGLIINIASVMGRIVLPFAASYTASKWAFEGMTETYKYELKAAGGGEAPKALNQQLAETQKQILTGFGMEAMV
ncbi:MAG: SDR family NAD(P)-dependent oxidoreductase [Spirochaetota bacterium]